MSNTKHDRIFISYSHKDQKYVDELKTMLAPAIRDDRIDVWDDRRIEPGAKWREEIQKALESTSTAVLMVSTTFLNSQFILRHELQPLLAAASEKGVRIFWICVNPCLYDQTEIASYQAAHDPARPLNQLNKAQREKVLREISDKLLRAPHAKPRPNPLPAHLQ